MSEHGNPYEEKKVEASSEVWTAWTMKSQRTAAFVQKVQYGFAASPGRRLRREFAGTVAEASLRDCRKLCCKLCGCVRSWLASIATCILTDDRWRPFAYPTVSRTALQGKHEIALEAAASGSAAFFFVHLLCTASAWIPQFLMSVRYVPQISCFRMINL